MRASDVMSRDVKTVSPTTPVSEIVQILIANRISAVPVVDAEGRIEGMVSEADLLHRTETGTEQRRPWWLDIFGDPDARAEAFLKAHGRTAAEVMTRALQVVDEDTSIDALARLMDERRVKRLPVVRDGKVVGIVARADLIRALATKGAASAGATLDDLAIKDRFEQTARSAGFGSVGSVTLVVKDGRVQLFGVAETATERKALEVAAGEIPGVSSVENHLALRDSFIETI